MIGTIYIEDVKHANEKAGKYWFSKDTLRFFKSRVAPVAYTTRDGKTAYFVSSEKFDHDTPRLYTVRMCDLTTGEIDTVGKFQAYKSQAAATYHAKKLAKKGEQ